MLARGWKLAKSINATVLKCGFNEGSKKQTRKQPALICEGKKGDRIIDRANISIRELLELAIHSIS
ncbi:MAG: hypothetical protein ACKERG_01170 [Candidatus Hodgkinia cicadicola]